MITSTFNTILAKATTSSTILVGLGANVFLMMFLSALMRCSRPPFLRVAIFACLAIFKLILSLADGPAIAHWLGVESVQTVPSVKGAAIASFVLLVVLFSWVSVEYKVRGNDFDRQAFEYFLFHWRSTTVPYSHSSFNQERYNTTSVPAIELTQYDTDVLHDLNTQEGFLSSVSPLTFLSSHRDGIESAGEHIQMTSITLQGSDESSGNNVETTNSDRQVDSGAEARRPENSDREDHRADPISVGA